MNKNHLLLALTCLIALSNPFNNTLYAQKNSVKIMPVIKGIGLFSASYELAITPRKSVQLEYQKWNQNRQFNESFLLTTDEQQIRVKGYRMEVMCRQYRRKALEGAFVEGGFYFGKHEIDIARTVTSYDPVAMATLRFDKIAETTVEHSHHKNIRVGGGKIGGGYQVPVGPVRFEMSGGMNINALNSKELRPTSAFKALSVYARVMVGVAF